ncbi:hypothetical protein [Methanobacterium oryzae]|uniref:hypothetical protein n=1 Tax=Methanobacterium oryzae TaxID=69540 RepID=UPI003D1BC0B2
MANSDEFTNQVYDTILKNFKNQSIYVKGKNGVNSIVIFDEPELHKEKSRYRIAYSNIMIFDDDKLLLAIEAIPHKPTPPKDIAGPIPIYMIARKVIVNMKTGNNKEYDLISSDSKFNLLIVVPDQPEGGQKSVQIGDLNEKFKGVFDMNSEYSNLKDFEICEFSAINSALNKLMKK